MANGVLRPRVPAATAPPTQAKTYFVELVLSQHGQVVDRNAYWLSTQRDEVAWDKTIGNPQATMRRYADLTALQSLPAAKLSVTAATHSQAGGPNGSDTVTEVTITNTGTAPTPAFFLRADVRRGTGAGTTVPGDNQVLPSFWTDNDITLWPGESQTLKASYRRSDLHGQSAVVSVNGWNVSAVDVAAP